MTSKQDKSEWTTRKDAEAAGYDPKAWRGCRIHSNNTSRHEYVKWCLCWVLDEMGRNWDTEVQCDTGRVDIFDYGPEDGKPLVYEIETDVTDARKKEKIEQYHRGPIRDVLVIDPGDVPSDFEEAIEYLRTNEVIG